jgi:hypothetical protein
MGATVMVIALVGLAFPIILILAAVLIDFLMVLWATYRWGHDRLAPPALGYLHRHFSEPIIRYAHAHPRGPFHLR